MADDLKRNTRKRKLSEVDDQIELRSISDGKSEDEEQFHEVHDTRSCKSSNKDYDSSCESKSSKSSEDETEGTQDGNVKNQNSANTSGMMDLDKLEIQWAKKLQKKTVEKLQYCPEDFITDESDYKESSQDVDSNCESDDDNGSGSDSETVSTDGKDPVYDREKEDVEEYGNNGKFSEEENTDENKSGSDMECKEGSNKFQTVKPNVIQSQRSTKQSRILKFPLDDEESKYQYSDDTNEMSEVDNELKNLDVSQKEPKEPKKRKPTSKKIVLRKTYAYDPDFPVPEKVTVDYYGDLMIPMDLRKYEYEKDVTTYWKVTGWERIDDFRYMYTLSVEPQLSRLKPGHWIRFAKIMQALGSKQDNKKCSDHVNIIIQ